ncbi:MAG: 4-alpha-glucanotransferase, partial [Oscillospiraceae bacterium]
MRTSGILMPISSLPSRYGIGTIGKEAFKFVDFLKSSGQSYWQILPIGPTGYGDSPYQSFSAFAANPYFIDLDVLIEDGYLCQAEVDGVSFGDNPNKIDYGIIFVNRFKILRLAANRLKRDNPQFLAFKNNNLDWLEDYSLFMAIKGENENIAFSKWSEELRLYEKAAINSAKERLSEEIFFWEAIQFFFFTQWRALKKYANENLVKIIGDIPIYVSPDSSDLWANSELFQVDEKKNPHFVAGCPPDAFSEDGQLWGNPLYNWDYHSKTNFEWWIRRLRYAGDVYDVVRIDHFRGFDGYYAIPAEDKTAVNGKWCDAPGKAFVDKIKQELPHIKIIAEDLGFLTESVKELLAYSNFPGMKILQFAFDSRDESDYLPHNFEKNCIVYTGTHDNTTTTAWKKTAPKDDVDFAKKYLNVRFFTNFTYSFIRAALGGIADTAIIPL